jgi:hypothetical protein
LRPILCAANGPFADGEDTEELPVHRQLHEKRGSVYAYTGELDAWRQSRRQLEPDCSDFPGQESSRISGGNGSQDGLDETAFNDDLVEPPMVPARFGAASKRYWLWILILAVATLCAIYTVTRPPWHDVPALVEVPLTTDPGHEVQPSLSPDGNQVAFAFDEGGTANYHIYVKAIGSEEAVRLTSHPNNDLSPSWSPDGQNVAFLRYGFGQNVSVMIVVSSGGERKATCNHPDGT